MEKRQKPPPGLNEPGGGFVKEASDMLRDMPLIVDDTTGITASEIKEKVRQMGDKVANTIKQGFNKQQPSIFP